MILPIYAYGHPVLKKKGEELGPQYEGLTSLIENMWDTMYNAKGIGLAAPQVGLSLRLFIVDTIQMQEIGEESKGIKKVFINPQIISEEGKIWAYEEGCLSIPNIHADVERAEIVNIKYFNENFEEQLERYDGMNARVIQHEYDHIEGNLFIEKINPLKKRLLQRRLENIKKGLISVAYKMKFYIIKK
ncbi:MAG TPA: peptide deformylase [Saprospiraceae bacterium]|nr:peptide deformylase [Saprospiraceae bacterium]